MGDSHLDCEVYCIPANTRPRGARGSELSELQGGWNTLFPQLTPRGLLSTSRGRQPCRALRPNGKPQTRISALPQPAEHCPWPSKANPGFTLRTNRHECSRKPCAQVGTEAALTAVRSGTDPDVPQAMNREVWSFHTKEHYSAMKRDGAAARTVSAPRARPGGKTPYCVLPFLCSGRGRQGQSQRGDSKLPGAGPGGWGGSGGLTSVLELVPGAARPLRTHKPPNGAHQEGEFYGLRILSIKSNKKILPPLTCTPLL